MVALTRCCVISSLKNNSKRPIADISIAGGKWGPGVRVGLKGGGKGMFCSAVAISTAKLSRLSDTICPVPFPRPRPLHDPYHDPACVMVMTLWSPLSRLLALGCCHTLMSLSPQC